MSTPGAATAPVEERVDYVPRRERRPAGAGGKSRGWQTLPDVDEMLDRAQHVARGIQEAEDALEGVRRRFEQTEEPEAQGQLAAEALDQVERQLSLARERRRELDSVEAKLWARRNRIERLLIQARGSGWWRARRMPTQGATSGERA